MGNRIASSHKDKPVAFEKKKKVAVIMIAAVTERPKKSNVLNIA
jgi:hypothetical protein